MFEDWLNVLKLISTENSTMDRFKELRPCNMITCKDLSYCVVLVRCSRINYKLSLIRVVGVAPFHMGLGMAIYNIHFGGGGYEKRFVLEIFILLMYLPNSNILPAR
jgi:hypothetical protein